MQTNTRASSNSKGQARKGTVPITAVRLNSQLAKAQSVFNRLSGQPRQKILAAMEVKGIAPSTAATYYHKLLSASRGSSRRSTSSTARGRRPDENSKAGIARRILARMSNQPRQKVLAAFIAKAKLTPAGASTYYHRLSAAA